MVELQRQNIVDIAPAVFLHQKLGGDAYVFVVDQGIVSDGQGALGQPVVFAQGYVGFGVYLVVILLNFHAVQPGEAVAEGVELLQKQVGDVRFFGQDTVGGSGQSLVPLDKATGQTPIILPMIAD